MLRELLGALLRQAAQSLVDSGDLPAGLAAPEVSEPRDPSHGDFACNYALTVSKAAGKNPREISELLKSRLEALADPLVSEVEVAGPGFLNVRLSRGHVASKVLEHVSQQGTRYAQSKPAHAQKVNVEFVSVNPNGPITVGSGRGAAFGSALCNVLETAGHTVHREYYVNDGVNSEQMRQFSLSVRALAKGEELPEKAYRGDYVQEVADKIKPAAQAAGWPEDPIWWQDQSQQLMLAKQKEDLATFGVEFDTWFSEQHLHDNGSVQRDVDMLMESGLADEQPQRTVLKLAKGGVIEEVKHEEQPVDEDDVEGSQPTLWLRSTKLGDDMDRVLRRKDGRLTYISSDVAYHHDKFSRPPQADKLITVLGPDHHGYIHRLTAVVSCLFLNQTSSPVDLNEIDASLYQSPEEKGRCLAALAEARRRLEVVIFQVVRFVRNGEPAPMRKRDGNIYALIDLVNEVGRTLAPEANVSEQQRLGRDVGRWFYLMRSHDTHLDFDIELATKKSDDNPVFYVQYAHARICSMIAKASEAGLKSQLSAASKLQHVRELALLKAIADLPHEVRRSAEDYGVHRLTTYAQEVARAFHHFYDECRVVDPSEPDMSAARLALCEATRTCLRSVFEILGVSAPESM